MEENTAMTHKFLAIAAMSLSLGATSALAQTDTTTGAGADAAVGGMQHGAMPMEWEGAIGDAFYSDPELGMLRADDEMRTNWEDLDEEDRTAVRDFCEQFAMDDEGPELGADAQAGAATDTTADTTTGAATGTGTVGTTTDTGATMEAADPGADMHQASLRQICELVEDDNS